MINKAHVISIGTLLGVLAVASTATFAQQWPARPVRIIVPFPPGQTADIATRLIAEPLSVTLGRQVIVDNRPEPAR